MMRLVPTPIPGLNYLLGGTRIKFRRYMSATIIGYIPSSVFFVSMGVAGQKVATGEAYTLAALHAYPLSMYIFGVVTIALVACWIWISAREILREVRAAL